MNYARVPAKDLAKLKLSDIQKLPKKDQTLVLEKLVKYHNQKYFIDNSPVISDEDFDKYSEALKLIDPSNQALFEIIGDIGDVVHPYPMLSIDKRFSYEDIAKWVEGINDNNFLVEPKYDGMRAIYNTKTGVLATRGNGTLGENITERFKHLKIIGKIDKNKDFVEGEIVIPTEFFDTNLSKDYKNSRNAVVGIVKAKVVNPAGVQALIKGGVHFVIYDQAYAQKVIKSALLDREMWEEILEEAFHSPYPLDGVVIKATDENLKSQLGATAHHERWQIAYKTPAEKKWSTVLSITDQVGRTGRITSVAHIKPIKLSGATVKNVTLHNFDYIEQTKIGVGSSVEVMRSGEVIPFITAVKGGKKPHKAPKKCPVCSFTVESEGKYLVCTNTNCPAKVSQSIEYYFKKLGVDELGLKTVERFINEFKISTIIDFYNLTEDKISPLEGFGDKSAKNIVTNIQGTLNQRITPVQLLNALGIKEVGGSTSKLIINTYGFKTLPKLTEPDLLEIKGIGPSIAKSFVNEIKAKWWVVESLQKKGLKFKKSNNTTKLAGLSFCITGKKEKYSREELIDIITKNGGDYKTSITKDLNYLIAGENAGSKITKAKALGVKIITEQQFLNLLN